MKRRAFSLLEVMVAMAILVVALAALIGHQGMAIQMADFSNRVSQATLLAQGKMLDVEYILLKDGMEEFDDCEDGDFRDEGFRKFEWKACAYKLEMNEGAGDALAQQVMGLLAGFQLPAAGANAPTEDPMGAVGGLGASVQMAMSALPSFLQLLEDKIRKVRVEVTWADAVGDRSLVLERFVTTLGDDRTGVVPKDGEAPPDPADLLGEAIGNLPGGNPAARQSNPGKGSEP
jgi:prepilin-type N-terminal cleavage/methylation domain-containing protein